MNRDAFPAAAPPPSALATVTRAFLSLFSSIWLGVMLLSLLFVYSSIGSSGVPTSLNIFDPASWKSVRQLRPFELTEFEWFNWWPFNLLIGLICLNLVVATLRRIPLNVVNLGVWMIHAGIITLALGSVWYFSTKLEGDAPVLRRRLVIEAPNAARISIPAQVGSSAAVGQGDDRYDVQVVNIDPRWELLSGDDNGQRAYKVSVMVRGRGGQFVRDLVANRPQYTQDLVRTNDPNQPMQRAVNVIGKPLVDEAVKLSLEYDPQQWFYLVHSRALYLREVDAAGRPLGAWSQRPIRSHGVGSLPRYNDHIEAAGDVWLPPGASPGSEVDPIRVAVPPTESSDPLPGITVQITGFLQYALLETRHTVDPDAPINPRIALTMIAPGGAEQRFDLLAFDSQRNRELDGNLAFIWAADSQQLERLQTRVDPVIRFSIPGTGIAVEETITATLAGDPDLAFKPLEGSEYAYRVQSLQDDLDFGGTSVSVAIVQIKGPQRTFTRWVSDNGSLDRDLAMTADAAAQHDATIETDTAIQTSYRKGTFPPAPIVLVAGPGEEHLSLIVTKASGPPTLTPLAPNQVVDIVNGVSLRVDSYATRTRSLTKPTLVPDEQRDRQMGDMLSMIRLNLPASGAGEAVWLPYNHYAFASREESLRHFGYRPVTIALDDGRRIEMMFGRERRSLPAPVALDDFAVDTHIGGFTGSTASILDWQSVIRFQGDDSQWLPPQSVRVNKPSEFNGYWFFQAQWDPPEPSRAPGEPAHAGLNFTVLGVGNRNGVHVMLLGCVISVLGMLYAFYAKPMIKQRRQRAVYRTIDAARRESKRVVNENDANTPELEPESVGAAMRAQP